MLARHLTLDLYNCKKDKIDDIALTKVTITQELNDMNFTILNIIDTKIDDNHYVVVFILKEGHLLLHAFKDLKYAALGIYLYSDNPKPERLAKIIRKIFRPDKVKTINLKRGDFINAKDYRPNVKTHISPLRRIRNTGTKALKKIRKL